MNRLIAGLGLFAAALCATATPAQARDGYLADVFMFAGNFCPRNSLPADGRLLPIAQNSALFSLLGTMYGGDGRTTFALPKLDAIEDSNGNPIRFCIMTQGLYPSRS